MVSLRQKWLLTCISLFASLSQAIVHHQSQNQTTRDKWTIQDVPNPTTNPKQCGLNSTGRVCDPDLLLSATDRKHIQQVLAQVGKETKLQCPDGTNHSYQAAVLVVKSIAHSEWIGAFGVHTWALSNKELTGERFAHEVGDSWGVGNAGCDNGVLLFLSIDDRMFYLKTAKRTREVLSDGEAELILKNMKPLLKSGETGDAILRGTEEIFLALQGKNIPVYRTWADYMLYVVLALVICVNLPALLTLLAIALAFLATVILWPFAKLADLCSDCWRYLFPSNAEKDLQRVHQELENDEFDQSMCPICLENFTSDGTDDQILSCKHRFHKRCIEEWIKANESCPLCRADVGEEFALSAEDVKKSEHYQRRLRFYLSRLAMRHPTSFRTTGRNRPMYYASNDVYFLYVPHTSYADSVTAHFSSATSTVASMGHFGGGGGGFGGGGFGGGGGAGGGW